MSDPGPPSAHRQPAGLAPSRAGDETPSHALAADEALRRLASSPWGLTEEEARRRLAEVGPNVLPRPPARAWSAILLDQLRSVVVLLLAAAALLALGMGEIVEAGAVGAVLLVNTALGFVTELRATRAMEALRGLEAPTTRVVRDGEVREVEARELVPGDVVELEAGDAVPADARLLEAEELRTDEAALTGESVPADKEAAAVLPDAAPLPGRINEVHQGTTVVAGRARAVVTATGARTHLGRIGALVEGVEEEPTPLEERLDDLGRRLVWIALGVAALVTAVGVLRGAPLVRMLEAGVALAVAAVPEGLPAVVTVTLAMGMWRMARRQALVRRLPAIEALGSATVICTDKTGTLTAGRMTVTELSAGGETFLFTGRGYDPEGEILRDGAPVPEGARPALEEALRIGALANRAALEREGEEWKAVGDPTEAALLVAARKAGLDPDELDRSWPERRRIPFSSERLYMASIRETVDGAPVLLAKGAPERMLDLSATEMDASGTPRKLTGDRRRELLEANEEMADRGLRVLALARGPAPADGGEASDLTFVGLVGMLDPPAEGVKETLRRVDAAGIRTLMLTGDQRRTAAAVARDLGLLDSDEEAVDASEIAGLSDRELAGRVAGTRVYSRIDPEQKYRVVESLRAGGDVVAMLGDGVNDAAALKRADIGVAMGGRGTDVAREAASLILRDDRFQTVAAAIEEGRVVFDNIRKFVFYLFSCNLAEVMVLLGAGLAGAPLPLLPLQILWLNLITDTFPALSLAFEPGEPDVMERPPRDPDSAILSARFLRAMGFYALLITAVTLAAFFWGLSEHGAGTRHAVTLSFLTLAFAQIFHLGNARSPEAVLSFARSTANRWALAAVTLAGALQLVAVYLPGLRDVLGLVPPTATEWGVVLGLSVVPAAVGQGLRLWQGRREADTGS